MRLFSTSWRSDIIDIAVLWFCVFAVVTYFLVWLWKQWASRGEAARSFQCLCKNITKRTSSLIGQACAKTIPGAPKDSDRAVSLAFTASRHNFVRRILHHGAPYGAAVVAVILYWSFNSGEDADGPNDIHPADGHLVSAALVLLTAALARIFEIQPSTKVCVSLKITVMCRLMWLLWYYPSGEMMLFDRTYVWSLRLGAALLPTDLRLALALNVIYSLSSCFAFSSYVQQEPELSLKLPHNPQRVFAAMEVFTLASISIIPWCFYSGMRKEACALVEATSSTNFRTAVTRLLRTIYDVVIEMDAHLRFVDNAETLAGMLLHGYKRSLRGVCLDELLASEDDRVRLKEHLTVNQRAGSDTTMAVPIRLHMRDSDGTILNVELLLSRFENLTSEVHYLMGLRELEIEAQTMPSIDADAASLQTQQRSHVQDDAFSTTAKHLEFKGTPAHTLQADAESVSLSSASIAKLLHPSLSETPLGTRKISLMQGALSWNIHMPRAGCCAYHALTKECLQVSKYLARHACSDVSKYVEDPQQCSRCGILFNVEDSTASQEDILCEICEGPACTPAHCFVFADDASASANVTSCETVAPAVLGLATEYGNCTPAHEFFFSNTCAPVRNHEKLNL